MKGLKFLAACAAVGAVSVACAAASFAVDTTYQLTVSQYNATNGTIDITVPTEYAKLVKGDYTLLVLSDDATSITEANKSIIKQIQQGDETILKGVKVGTITPTEADQTFYVRVGGADADTNTNPTGYAAGTFTVKGTGSDNPYADSTRLVGDINGGDVIDSADILGLQLYVLDVPGNELQGESLQAADCNDSGVVDSADILALQLRVLLPEQHPFTITEVKNKTKYIGIE